MYLYYTLLMSLYLFGSCQNPSKKETPPNVILIFADDLGYGELGAYGQSKIETPHLDKLASEGMRLTSYYTGSPVCAPSRCILLTGMHSGHAVIRGNDEAGHRGEVWDFLAMASDPYLEGQAPMPDTTVTFPMLLQKQGYTTGMCGKWGLGHPLSVSTPNKKGFDYFYGYNCQRQAHTLTPLHLWENDLRVPLSNDTIVYHTDLPIDADSLNPHSYAYLDQPDYAPELIANQCIQFVRKNKNQPFFLYWATPIPHLPLQAPKKWVDYYVQKFGDEPPYTGRNGGYFPARYPKATYAAMISYLDENIGKLLKTLEELKIDDNTIILFTSDNGPTYVSGTDTPWFDSAGPFKTEKGWGKGSLREGGIRMPFIARWSNHITPGTSSDHMCSSQDVMATIFDLLQIPLEIEHDGISFAPTLLEQDDQEQHEYLYWEFPQSGGQRALRWGDWKAYNHNLKADDTTIYLYNLSEDIQEQNDVAGQHPDKVRFVQQAFKKEHVPSTNPRWQYDVLDKGSD